MAPAKSSSTESWWDQATTIHHRRGRPYTQLAIEVPPPTPDGLQSQSGQTMKDGFNMPSASAADGHLRPIVKSQQQPIALPHLPEMLKVHDGATVHSQKCVSIELLLQSCE